MSERDGEAWEADRKHSKLRDERGRFVEGHPATVGSLGKKCSDITKAKMSDSHQGKRSVGASKYVGVTWYKSRKKWFAQIVQSGVRYAIGYFVTEELAARAYDDWAKWLYGKNARVNFKDGDKRARRKVKKNE